MTAGHLACYGVTGEGIEKLMRRLKWFFPGITALLVGYVLYRRSESKRVVEEDRRYLEREEKLKAVAAAMKDEADAADSPPPLDKSPNRPGRSN